MTVLFASTPLQLLSEEALSQELKVAGTNGFSFGPLSTIQCGWDWAPVELTDARKLVAAASWAYVAHVS